MNRKRYNEKFILERNKTEKDITVQPFDSEQNVL